MSINSDLTAPTTNQHPIDELIDAARDYREGRLQSLGVTYPACLFNIVWREYFRNVLEAICDAENGFLTEADYDDNFVDLKLAFKQKRALSNVAEAKEDGKEPVAVASAAFDIANEDIQAVDETLVAICASAACDAANEDIQAVDEILVAIEHLASVPKPPTRKGTKAKKSGR